MAEEFLVFYALGGCTFPPQSKAGGFERLSHVGNNLALGKARDFTNFFKSDPVGPGSPDNPIRTILGGFGFFDPGNWTVGLFGLHSKGNPNFI